MRPIICICNDLYVVPPRSRTELTRSSYAPTLRPLRPIARIIRFTPPTNVMLVHRLRTICDEEGLGADSKNLTMLTEIAEGDLRSCLNTLQVRLPPSSQGTIDDCTSSSSGKARSSTRMRSSRPWSA